MSLDAFLRFVTDENTSTNDKVVGISVVTVVTALIFAVNGIIKKYLQKKVIIGKTGFTVSGKHGDTVEFSEIRKIQVFCNKGFRVLLRIVYRRAQLEYEQIFRVKILYEIKKETGFVYGVQKAKIKEIVSRVNKDLVDENLQRLLKGEGLKLSEISLNERPAKNNVTFFLS